jgi:hypothetical protein
MLRHGTAGFVLQNGASQHDRAMVAFPWASIRRVVFLAAAVPILILFSLTPFASADSLPRPGLPQADWPVIWPATGAALESLPECEQSGDNRLIGVPEYEVRTINLECGSFSSPLPSLSLGRPRLAE